MPLRPRDAKKALDLLTANPARERSIAELAAECGVAGRTLQKHFRRFLGRTPGEVLRDRASSGYAMKGEARQSFAGLVSAYPELTIAQVRSALPHTARF